MAINIKKPEVEALARELARLTGETMTSAVETALQERLDRWKAEQRRERMLEDIKRITSETAALWTGPITSTNLGDYLYDEETGLPK